MPPDVTCPACQHHFAGSFTCPRCGAALPRTEVRPGDGNIQAAPPAPAALATTVCPACGKAVPELCLLCPHCEEPLAERHRVAAPGGRPLFAKMQLPLAAVGALVIVMVMAGAVAALVSGGVVELVLGGLAFFVLVCVTLIVFAASHAARARTRTFESPGGLALEALAGLGCLFLTGVAAVLFMIAVCIASGGPK
jgi:hypothetical protein